MQLRQGDVLLQRVDETPAHSTAVLTATRVVIAEGEKTGHHHAVVGDDVRVFEEDGTLYLEVPQGAVLEHEEHDALPLDSGTYQVVRQREFAPGPSKALRLLKASAPAAGLAFLTVAD